MSPSNSGKKSVNLSSNDSLPSLTNISAAVVASGLVIDAIK